MIQIAYSNLKKEFKRVLLKHSFSKDRADLIASIFTDNSLDGVLSHGINRFPGFIQFVEKGYVVANAEPECVSAKGALENWDGKCGPGMYNAHFCMERAIALSKKYGIGCVSLFNNNHWMRGGTYGWQAADAGCIGICFTNSQATMPPWGGSSPRLGNNPLVIAVPRKEGHIVLDMALSQFSFGKMKEYALEGKQLPYYGGYDEEGKLTKDPNRIRKSGNALPIGKWKGSGLSLLLDLIVTGLTGGQSTAGITKSGVETRVSQCFIAIHKEEGISQSLTDQILDYIKSSDPVEEGKKIYYPGERTLQRRQKNRKEGIPVSEEYLNQLKEL